MVHWPVALPNMQASAVARQRVTAGGSCKAPPSSTIACLASLMYLRASLPKGAKGSGREAVVAEGTKDALFTSKSVESGDDGRSASPYFHCASRRLDRAICSSSGWDAHQLLVCPQNDIFEHDSH